MYDSCLFDIIDMYRANTRTFVEWERNCGIRVDNTLSAMLSIDLIIERYGYMDIMIGQLWHYSTI